MVALFRISTELWIWWWLHIFCVSSSICQSTTSMQCCGVHVVLKLHPFLMSFHLVFFFFFFVCTLSASICLCGNSQEVFCVQPSWLAYLLKSLVCGINEFSMDMAPQNFFYQDGCDYWHDEEGAMCKVHPQVCRRWRGFCRSGFAHHQIGKSHHDFCASATQPG